PANSGPSLDYQGSFDGTNKVCKSVCTDWYPEGTDVYITGDSGSGYFMSDWSGACASEPSVYCNVKSLSGPTSISGTFKQSWYLFVKNADYPKGTIGESSPSYSGDCNTSDCIYAILDGETSTLT